MWVQRLRQAFGFTASAELADAAVALALDADTTARLGAVLNRVRTTEPDLIERLHEVVAQGSRFDHLYD